MQQYSKVTAAVLAGAFVTILVAVGKAYPSTMGAILQDQSVQSALQTLVTAFVVFIAPANKAS